MSLGDDEDDPRYQRYILSMQMAYKFVWSNGEDRMYFPLSPCPQACRPVPCPNAAVCGSFELPEWLLLCKRGLCMQCSISRFNFRVLSIHDTRMECPVCLSEKFSAVRLDCGHRVCVECFIVIAKMAVYGPSEVTGIGCPLCRRLSFVDK